MAGGEKGAEAAKAACLPTALAQAHQQRQEASLPDLHRRSDTSPAVPAGAALSVTLASLVAVGALLVFVRRQRAQLQLLQRERSAPSFSSLGGGGGGGKSAGHATFSIAGHRPPGERVKALTIPSPWGDEADGYIQVRQGAERDIWLARATLLLGRRCLCLGGRVGG